MAYADVILAESSLQSYWHMGESSGSIVDSEGAVTGTAYNLDRNQTSLIPTYSANGCVRAHTTPSMGAVLFGAVYGFSPTSSFSVEVWMKLVTLSSGVIFGRNGWGTGIGGYFAAVSAIGECYWERTDGVAYDTCAAPSSVVVGTTYHVVCTYDGSQMLMYLNGTAGSAQASTRSINPGAGDNFTLCDLGSGLDGYFDELAVYNATLSGSAVLAHYQAGVGQIIFPDADTETTGWTTTPLWSKVSDSSDSTYITATSA